MSLQGSNTNMSPANGHAGSAAQMDVKKNKVAPTGSVELEEIKVKETAVSEHFASAELLISCELNLHVGLLSKCYYYWQRF